jgi:hypothetical protein
MIGESITAAKPPKLAAAVVMREFVLLANVLIRVNWLSQACRA